MCYHDGSGRIAFGALYRACFNHAPARTCTYLSFICTFICERACVSTGRLGSPSPERPPRLAQGLSIACSTPAAIAWDSEWAGTHEISGRVMKTVHEAGAHLKDAPADEAGDAATALVQVRACCVLPCVLVLESTRMGCKHTLFGVGIVFRSVLGHVCHC